MNTTNLSFVSFEAPEREAEDESVDGHDVPLPDEVAQLLHVLVDLLTSARVRELRHQVVCKRAQM